jgi:hypothetical protein
MPIKPVEGQPNIASAENQVIRRDRRANIDALTTQESRNDALQAMNKSQRTLTAEDRLRADRREIQRTQDRTETLKNLETRKEGVAGEIKRRNAGMGSNMDIFG